MHRELRQQIKDATERSGINKLDFIALLKLIDQHYDKMEATITQSLATQTLTSQSLNAPTPIDLIFDSVTDALLSVDEQGIIRNCNKVCAGYFGIAKQDLIGAPVTDILAWRKQRAATYWGYGSCVKSGRQDSNLRPLDPQSSTLAKLRHAPSSDVSNSRGRAQGRDLPQGTR